MDKYKAQTRVIIRRFLRNRIDFADCITGLEHALARSLPGLNNEQMEVLRVHLLSNNDTVMQEMARRAALASPQPALIELRHTGGFDDIHAFYDGGCASGDGAAGSAAAVV